MFAAASTDSQVQVVQLESCQAAPACCLYSHMVAVPAGHKSNVHGMVDIFGVSFRQCFAPDELHQRWCNCCGSAYSAAWVLQASQATSCTAADQAIALPSKLSWSVLDSLPSSELRCTAAVHNALAYGLPIRDPPEPLAAYGSTCTAALPHCSTCTALVLQVLYNTAHQSLVVMKSSERLTVPSAISWLNAAPTCSAQIDQMYTCVYSTTKERGSHFDLGICSGTTEALAALAIMMFVALMCSFRAWHWKNCTRCLLDSLKLSLGKS
jgi:hypothetical protein